MDTLLIAGLDSLVGINLAARLIGRFNVVGINFREPVSLEDCHSGLCPAEEENDVREWVESIRPAQLVYCGPASHSTWDATQPPRPGVHSVETAGRWAAAAREYGAAFTLISSDAVFTGPWVFHDEDSNCHCRSAEARAARRAETTCARQCPGALIVRTNAFGWSHTYGWLEQLADGLEAGDAGPFDFQRHATPILATDLADILARAWAADLEGTYHIAGATRINPNQFAQRLAEEFGLPAPHPVDGNRLRQRPVGYGCGETSLHTTRVRKALDVATPDVDAGLHRLREQKRDGYCERLKSCGVLEHAA